MRGTTMSLAMDGTQDPFGFVSRDNSLIQGYRPWVFGEDAPSKLQSSEQDLAARLQGIEGGGVERHRVGSVSAVGPDGLSDGSGKSGKQALGRWRGFDPIESGG